ncbi:MAG TPA: alpha/beta hydrolase [Myxococcota bacterium]|nr:alpha/beta hydrolase [Myxococcota bacterium]
MKYGAAFLVALGLALLAAHARAQGKVHEAIAYAGDADGAPTLDLFLPSPSDVRPPLLAFVQSRFWRDDTKPRDLVLGLARPLQHAGAAVALIRHRAAPEYVHPRQAEDVAAALDFLVAHADEYGYDPTRIALAGRGSGAQLAALVALDPHYLEAHERSPDSLIGVGTLSGIYDLDPKGGFASEEEEAVVKAAFPDPRKRDDASPLSHVRKDAPLFLVTFTEADLPGAQRAGLDFAQALRDVGHPAAEAFGIERRDYRNQIDLTDERNPLRQHLLALLQLGPAWSRLPETFGMRRFWRDPQPPLESAGFWKDHRRVVAYDADPRFLETLNLLFTGSGGPPRLRPTRYHALDLFAWLERHAKEVGRGRHLTLTNARGEKSFFDLEALRPYEPRIVVGIDEERELFRLVDFYHTDRRNTWEQQGVEKWILARPVGAFLHFGKPPPRALDPRAIGRFALTPESFALTVSDPLAPLAGLSPNERRILTDEFRCVSCHGFQGVGARAVHLRARDGAQVGGYGLPLEEYPEEVWRRYCFEQPEVAALIGANPVPLGADAPVLFELVERARANAKAGRADPSM